MAAVVEELILLLSGSFNPISCYHLRVLELARQYFVQEGYEKTSAVLSPTPNTSTTEADCASGQDRLTMCQLAVKDLDHVSVDDWECNQRSYAKLLTVTSTLSSNNNNCKVGVLVSEEQLCQVSQWANDNVKLLLEQHLLVCVTANPHRIINFAQHCPVFRGFEESIHLVIDHAGNAKPSIMPAVEHAQSITGLVPACVQEYMEQQNLYITKEQGKIGMRVPSKDRVVLPRIHNTAAPTVKKSSLMTQGVQMRDLLSVNRVLTVVPSIESVYAELLQRQRPSFQR